VLEPAVPADASAILARARALNEHDGTVFRESVYRLALERLLADPDLGRVWLARDGAPAVVYAVLTLGFSLEFGGRDGLLDDLFVLEPYRRRGIGPALLELVEGECRLGLDPLQLGVERGNAQARGLYRRLGFLAHDRDMTRWL
jgi:GNAT superfamily N-acetyltransferase